MIIPFEIVRNISGYLLKKEMLECLTVCKSWYRAMFESLYGSVTIKTCGSFRAFLYVIAHHELTPGKFVRKMELYIEDFNERPVTFTEFELLTRYCINLHELLFSHNKYWRCMNELNLSNVWLHLAKVPISRNRLSLQVCNKMKDRLQEVVFFEHDQSIMSFISSPSPKLLKAEITTRFLLLKTSTVKSLHLCAPRLQELSLMVCMENINETNAAASVIPLIEKHNNHIQTLKCIIHHPDSAWFPIIKSTYHNVDKLTLVVNNILPKLPGYTARRYTKFEIVRSIIDLIKSTDIRQLNMDFRYVDDISFMQAATATLLYDHCNESTNLKTSVSVKSSFAVPDDFDYSCRFKSKLTTTLEQPGQQKVVRQELDYRFMRDPDEEDEDNNVSEVDLLEYAIIRPINKLVVELFLDVGIGGEFSWSSIITKKRAIYFDQILNYFSNLESLTLTSTFYEFCGSCLQNDIRFTLSTSSTKVNYKFFKCLTVNCVSVDKCIFQFLFKNCPALEELTLIDCQLDEVTVLILECLSLESDVLLDIKQDDSKKLLI